MNEEWDKIITPIKVGKFAKLLKQTDYDSKKSQYLIQGFRQGFDLGYQGPEKCKDEAENIPLHIGTPTEMWNEIMKEVKEKRYAGPFKKLPFKHYIQSPIGLVPKSGNKTRLIFHLS